MNIPEVSYQGEPLIDAASSRPNWNRRIIISCIALIVCFEIAGWFRGRWWVLSDAAIPSYGQSACCTILLSQGDVALRQSMHQSLSDHTDIASRLHGVMEFKAYSPLVFPIGYIKINAPEESIGQIASTAHSHLSSTFPSIRPEFRFGFAP